VRRNFSHEEKSVRVDRLALMSQVIWIQTMKNTSEILALQTEINEVSKAMYKTWSRTGNTIKANEAHLKSLCTRLDQLLNDTQKHDEVTRKNRRLGIK